jgi:tRNA(fMet)-specific endonuclease VapC
VKYLLDTDIVSRIGRAGSESVTERFRATPSEELAISVITRGEIEFGLQALQAGRETVARMRELMRRIAALPLGEAVAVHYASLRSQLRADGTPIGHNDLWIAAHALTLGLTLVTNNEREFRRVRELKVENWLR